MWPRQLVLEQSRISGRMALGALAVGIALVGLTVVPVRSQTLQLEALRSEADIPVGDPWAAVWDTARGQDVPLSAQNVSPPFGGGTVDVVTVRALHDEQSLYVLVEWGDPEPNSSVVGNLEFSDAAALQFPVVAETATPYTMGGPGTPVNIWQWKAVWQADLNEGYGTSGERFPNTYVDFYPEAADQLYLPAEQVGNPLAQRDHTSPIENLVAEGFGTLTNVATQDVVGAGEWRSGRWRALFARELESTSAEAARFAVGESTMVAFAVWDGGSGDRNGQKSIAQFIDLTLVSEAAPEAIPGEAGPGVSIWVLFFAVAAVLVLVVRLGTWGARAKSDTTSVGTDSSEE